MNILLLLATPLITLVMHLGTGLFILRNAKLNPVEKLLASVALSGIVLYLAGFAGYLTHHPQWTSIFILIVSIVGLESSVPVIRSILSSHQVRKIIISTLGLLLWSLLLMSLIRCYNGALWYGDWFEHYERVEVFTSVNPIDVNHKFLNGMYALPARPPFQNIVAAIVTAPGKTSFDTFAFAMTTLNVLVAPAGMLLLSTVAKRGRRVIYIYAALLALSPMFVQNATFTWTKLYAGFYALTGFYFYLRILRQPNRLHLILSSLCFAAGTLVHYSIVPYVIVLSIPFALRWASGSGIRLGHVSLALIFAIILISTWVGFSLYQFGLTDTLGTNTSVTDSAQMSFKDNLVKIARNLFVTIVPTWPDDPRLSMSGVGYWRDRFFTLYQTTLPLMFGVAGICLLFSRKFWRRASPSPEFWIYYIVGVSALGVAVHGSPAMFGGLANVSLTPLAIHGVGLVAVALSGIKERFWLRWIAAGFLFDAIFGIIIHWFLQSRSFPFVLFNRDPDLTKTAYENLLLKQNSNLIFPYDHWPSMRWPLLVIVALTLSRLVFFVTRSRRID